MMDVELLRRSQYQQVAEWEFGPQESVDWTRYYAEMNEPQWAHFAIYSHADFVGCLSLEKIDQQTIAFHVVTARKKVNSHSLAQVLLKMAGDLFNSGYTVMVVRIPKDKRAAAILALRCGMVEDAPSDKERSFTLTKSRFQHGK